MQASCAASARQRCSSVPTAKQRVRALIRGAPPSLVALTDRFRSITAPMLSAALSGNVELKLLTLLTTDHKS